MKRTTFCWRVSWVGILGSTLGFLTISHHPFDHPGLFYLENKTKLRTVAEDSRYENPKMSKLEKVLLQQFEPSAASRAILFSKTRNSTHCLLDWVTTNVALQKAGIKAAMLTGAGGGLSHMTQVSVRCARVKRSTK